jgi:NADPH:quinone reductase-like Zn-dependent oxidoreductase
VTTGSETMQAIVQDEYGEAGDVLRLEEIDRPATGNDEVLVRVHAAGVDRGTWHTVAGLPKLIRFFGFGIRAPKSRVPGRAFAGTVEAIGRDVTGFAVGDEVFGSTNGSFAEFASAPPGRLAHKPANLSFEQAAAVPISAQTALQALRDRGKVQAGEHVLIIGASGGVGTYAVQIAKAFDAEVTGVCSPAKVDMVRALGADHVLDYERDNFADGVHHYDVILDIGGNSRLSRLRRALTHKGRLVIVGGETHGRWVGGFDRSLRAPMVSLFVSQKLTMLVSSEKAEDLVVLRELIEAGKVTPAIDRTYPLRDAAAAIQYMQDGHARGKLVITI